ncbi:hypothetical protein C8Q75DRAFT_729990 [Abortiporus biennis]|nr:hypothetical protein C8Q75DRAFT_729990 [Abortiporus biennis]
MYDKQAPPNQKIVTRSRAIVAIRVFCLQPNYLGCLNLVFMQNKFLNLEHMFDFLFLQQSPSLSLLFKPHLLLNLRKERCKFGAFGDSTKAPGFRFWRLLNAHGTTGLVCVLHIESEKGVVIAIDEDQTSNTLSVAIDQICFDVAKEATLQLQSLYHEDLHQNTLPRLAVVAGIVMAHRGKFRGKQRLESSKRSWRSNDWELSGGSKENQSSLEMACGIMHGPGRREYERREVIEILWGRMNGYISGGTVRWLSWYCSIGDGGSTKFIDMYEWFSAQVEVWILQFP